MTTTRTGTTLVLAAIIAGSLLSVSGMASIHPALAAKPEEAPNHGDPKGDVKDPNHLLASKADFDIKNAHREGNGKLVMEVFGTAGHSSPAQPATGGLGQVFVYVFVTDNGIWVVNQHWDCHIGLDCSQIGNGEISPWHSEKVKVESVAGHTNPCVTDITDEREATMSGQKAIVNVPEAHKVLKGQTAAFDILVNPDDFTPGECVAELNTVFDQT
jgi:hypothetical protein